MQTETLDRLYLEWSQFTNAKTAREKALEKENESLKARVAELEGIRKRLSDLLHNTKHCALWPDDLAYALYGDDWEAKVREVSDVQK